MSTRKNKANKIKDPYTIQDFYKDYLKQFPQGSDYYLTYIEYRDITTLFFKHLYEQVIYKSTSVILPFRLGRISVIKTKPVYKSIKNMVMDWVKAKELNKQVRNFNEHSRGFRYKFLWDRRTCSINNNTAYMFIPARNAKREVARLIKTHQNDYFER